MKDVDIGNMQEQMLETAEGSQAAAPPLSVGLTAPEANHSVVSAVLAPHPPPAPACQDYTSFRYTTTARFIKRRIEDCEDQVRSEKNVPRKLGNDYDLQGLDLSTGTPYEPEDDDSIKFDSVTLEPPPKPDSQVSLIHSDMNTDTDSMCNYLMLSTPTLSSEAHSENFEDLVAFVNSLFKNAELTPSKSLSIALDSRNERAAETLEAEDTASVRPTTRPSCKFINRLKRQLSLWPPNRGYKRLE